jgi:hypothetical protein
MTRRVNPFVLVFEKLASEHFPLIRAAIANDPARAQDRDRFVLLGPVAQLVRELAPDESPPEAIEAYVRLVHHGYRYWAEGAWTYDVDDARLDRAVAGGAMTSRLPLPALYLRLPALRVWGAAHNGDAPEPMDGVFLTETPTPGTLAALGIFGMHGERPGFSAVPVEGHADAQHATVGEIEVPTEREDGTPVLASQLAGGSKAAVYSVADAGEMLLLVCRLLVGLTAPPPGDTSGEHIVQVE